MIPSPTAGTGTGTPRGTLVSIEGVNGVGKTYLTHRLLEQMNSRGLPAPRVIEEFSARTGTTDLGRALLTALRAAAGGDYFLRGGHPRSETLLLAIKTHDHHTAEPALRAGHTVIEGRGPHTTAAYQAAILHPDDDTAAEHTATRILAETTRWRPLPDLTVIVTDDLDTALDRAHTRDRRPFSADEQRLLNRAVRLFEHLATTDPDRVRLLDRRVHNPVAAVALLTEWIAHTTPRPPAPPLDAG
ncbi:thymidylate kinase [Actinokineospora cianjurensis]|uniref:Thymidylate kinase n=1 Tax=Actinokineospora cianjurensis TaxID=585224 RepID=A0A421B217_9PSEU|nr:thymidylate kinase [Actinokineospora cianjurensis]RLK58388.1 thymidylate kinase [Actinokineospora cianjurensis]